MHVSAGYSSFQDLIRGETMGHKLMENTGAACGDAVINMSPDKSVLILLKHCQDMKQQETRLRLSTLFLLLGCTALFIFTIFADLRQNSGFGGQESPAEHSAAFSKQELLCGAENAQNESRSVHNELRSVFEDNVAHNRYMKWESVMGEDYSEEERAIVIPVEGFYFVYVSFDLGCHDYVESEAFKRFSVQLHRLPDGYNGIENLTKSQSGIRCPSERYRTVFVGRQFNLFKDDRVKVWLSEGYKLITSSSFGVFRV